MSSLHCTACGNEAKTNCNCGKPCRYMPAHEAAALAVASHPEWSDRKLAEATGMDHKTIAAARKQGGENSPPKKRIGRDGVQQAARKRNPSPKRDKVQPAVDELVANGVPVNRKELAKQHGCGEHAIQLAEARAQGRLEATQAEPVVKLEDLPKSAQKKVDAITQQYRKQLEAEFETTVLREIARRVDEYVAPRFFERERDAERCREATRRKGLFKREEYNVILRCVHPDLSPSIDEKNEAFRLLHENRLLLLSEKDDPRTYPPIPTADEFMAGIKRPFRKTE